MSNCLAVTFDLREDWKSIGVFCSSSHRQYLIPGAIINETPPEEFYNLPFLLAYALLDQVLSEWRDQKLFDSSWELGAKMEASKKVILWHDYGLVFNGKEARNDLAHRAKLLTKEDCLLYIEAIRKEFEFWSLL